MLQANWVVGIEVVDSNDKIPAFHESLRGHQTSLVTAQRDALKDTGCQRLPSTFLHAGTLLQHRLNPSATTHLCGVKANEASCACQQDVSLRCALRHGFTGLCNITIGSEARGSRRVGSTTIE